MADILIRGMEMPQSCFFCKIYTHNGGNCLQLQKHVSTDRFSQDRDKDCPLVEVPTHGRLIDADEFEKKNEYFWHRDFINPKYSDTLEELVNAAPTIIPASEVD